MDKNCEFPPFSPYGMGFDNPMEDMYSGPMFSPMAQYEQAYMYYKCMCQQLDYKMKLKEYEKLNKPERRIE